MGQSCFRKDERFRDTNRFTAKPVQDYSLPEWIRQAPAGDNLFTMFTQTPSTMSLFPFVSPGWCGRSRRNLGIRIDSNEAPTSDSGVQPPFGKQFEADWASDSARG
jgi:hypothetical protein